MEMEIIILHALFDNFFFFIRAYLVIFTQNLECNAKKKEG